MIATVRAAVKGDGDVSSARCDGALPPLRGIVVDDQNRPYKREVRREGGVQHRRQIPSSSFGITGRSDYTDTTGPTAGAGH